MVPMVGKPLTQPECTRLQDFHTLSAARVLTLDIDMNKRRDNIIQIRGGIPARRPSRFGQEQQVQLEDLEAAVIDFIQSCTGSKTLVLMGFGMAAEWEYLFQDSPQVIPYLSHGMGRSTGYRISYCTASVLPTLTGVLKVFGYTWKSLKPGRRDGTSTGTADNASDDALATLALAQALLEPQNQQKLTFRQACSQIARFDRKGYQDPGLPRFPFIATVESRNRMLPQSIDSGMKLARKFFDFAPSCTGRMLAEQAYLSFATKTELDRFIQHANALVLSTGDIPSARQLRPTDSPDLKGTEEISQQRQKQEPREQRRIEKSIQDELEDLGRLFSD